MSNVFALNLDIHEKYDLKGSYIGRTSFPNETEFPYKPMDKDLSQIIQKDLDFNRKILLGPKKKKKFLKQLEKDSTVLSSFFIFILFQKFFFLLVFAKFEHYGL